MKEGKGEEGVKGSSKLLQIIFFNKSPQDKNVKQDQKNTGNSLGKYLNFDCFYDRTKNVFK